MRRRDKAEKEGPSAPHENRAREPWFCARDANDGRLAVCLAISNRISHHTLRRRCRHTFFYSAAAAAANKASTCTNGGALYGVPHPPTTDGTVSYFPEVCAFVRGRQAVRMRAVVQH